MEMRQTETDLKRTLKGYLDIKKIYNFPLTQGLGSHRGAPDRIMHFDGRVHYLEVKTPTGKLSAYQEAFRDQCARLHTISRHKEFRRFTTYRGGLCMKAVNTNRDKLIREIYKKGEGAMIGRWWGISRQRVHQVVSQNAPNQNLRGLRGWLMKYIKRLIAR